MLGVFLYCSPLEFFEARSHTDLKSILLSRLTDQWAPGTHRLLSSNSGATGECDDAWLYIGSEDLNSGSNCFHDKCSFLLMNHLISLWTCSWSFCLQLLSSGIATGMGHQPPNGFPSNYLLYYGSCRKSVLFYNWKDKNKNVTCGCPMIQRHRLAQRDVYPDRRCKSTAVNKLWEMQQAGRYWQLALRSYFWQ